MRTLTLFILILIFYCPLSWGSQCSHLIGDCDYYQCVQNNKDCYKGGYLLNYGRPYCQTFRELEEENNDSYLNDWIRDTRSCLMHEMEEFWENKSCLALGLAAFNSHVPCYEKTGFCQMPLKYKIIIFNKIKKSFYNPLIYPSVIKFMRSCIQ